MAKVTQRPTVFTPLPLERDEYPLFTNSASHDSQYRVPMILFLQFHGCDGGNASTSALVKINSAFAGFQFIIGIYFGALASRARRLKSLTNCRAPRAQRDGKLNSLRFTSKPDVFLPARRTEIARHGA